MRRLRLEQPSAAAATKVEMKKHYTMACQFNENIYIGSLETHILHVLPNSIVHRSLHLLPQPLIILVLQRA